MCLETCTAEQLYHLEKTIKEIHEALLADDRAFYTLTTILSIIAASIVFLTIFIAAEVSMSARE